MTETFDQARGEVGRPRHSARRRNAGDRATTRDFATAPDLATTRELDTKGANRRRLVESSEERIMGKEDSVVAARPWSVSTRVVFRFLFVYLLLSMVTPFGLLGLLLSALLEQLGLRPGVGEGWKQAVEWVGRTVL